MTQGALAELVGRRTAIAAARAALGGLTDLLDAVAEAELPAWLAGSTPSPPPRRPRAWRWSSGP